MAFGGGPPMLSLLTGLARGVTEHEERKRQKQREAIIDRLRNAQVESTRANIDIAKEQQKRLREREARLAAQQEAQQVAAEQEAERRRAAARVRAEEIMQDNPDMDPQTAAVRAQAEIAGDLDPIGSQSEREFEERKRSLDLEGKEVDIALDRRRMQQMDQEGKGDRVSQEVSGIMDDELLLQAVIDAEGPDQLARIYHRHPANRGEDGQSPKYSLDAILAAKDQMDDFDSGVGDLQARLTGRVNALGFLQRAGCFDRADAALAEVTKQDLQPDELRKVEAIVDALDEMRQDNILSQKYKNCGDGTGAPRPNTQR